MYACGYLLPVKTTPMETIHKEHYDAPSTMVFEVRQEGVICQSETGTEGNPTYNGFDTEETW